MRKLALAGALLVVLAAGWSGAWFVIARKLEQAIDVWIDEEKGRDRFWTCGSRASEGFPFEFRINCAAPAFASQTGPVQLAAATRLNAAASIFAPFDIGFSVDGPLKIASRNGAATVEWKSLEGAFRPDGHSSDLSVKAAALRIVDATGDAAAWTGSQLRDFAARVQRSPDRAPGSDVQALTFSVDGVTAGPLDSFFGNEELFRANASAVVLNAGAANSGNFMERVDRWIASGGRVQISSFSAEKGRSRMEASGDLTLDDLRRPAGQLSVRLAGIQPVLARFNMPAAPLAIEGLLRGGGNRGGGASLIENRTLPLELRGGRIYVGPLRLPVAIPPLI